MERKLSTQHVRFVTFTCQLKMSDEAEFEVSSPNFTKIAVE